MGKLIFFLGGSPGAAVNNVSARCVPFFMVLRVIVPVTEPGVQFWV